MSRGDDNRAKVTATWELSVAALAAEGKQCAGVLLRILSCFASNVQIPGLLLDRQVLAGICGSGTNMEEGLSGLLSVGLIELAVSPEGERQGVKVHPLVGETIRFKAGRDLLAGAQHAVELLTAAVSHLDFTDPATSAQWIALSPHLQALQLLDLQMSVETESSLAWAAAQVSSGVLWGSRYLAAFDIAEAGLKRAHCLPGDHAEVLNLRERRASAQQLLGRYYEAESEFRQVLEAQVEALVVAPVNSSGVAG